MTHTAVLTGTLLICFLAAILICGIGSYFLIRLSEKLDEKKCIKVLLLFAFAGFLLRLLFVIFSDCMPISDYKTMFSAAEGFAKGDKSAFMMGSYMQRFPHMTFFPVVSGFLMKIFGADVLVIKIFSCIFKFAAILGAGLVGKEIYGKKGMLTSGFLYAIFPVDIFYTAVFASENFAIAFFIFSVLFYIKAFKSEKLSKTFINSVICGLLLSAGCLFRGVAPFYLVAFAGGIILLFAKFKRKVVALLSLVLAYFLLFNTVSLMLHYGKITEYKLTDTGEPFTVYMLVGSNFDTFGMYSQEDHNVYIEADEDGEKASKIAVEKMLERYINNPGKIIPHFLKKTEIVWVNSDFDSVYWAFENNGVEGEKGHTYILKNMGVAYIGFAALMLVCALFYSRKKKELFLLMLIVLAFMAGLCLIEIQPRYGYSAAYAFSLFTSVGVCGLYEYKKGEYEMNNYLKLARVHHYVKNVFILLPLFFSMQLLNMKMLGISILGIVAFSLMASAVYVINDLIDAEKDRQHPKKKLRPIASGAVSEKNAKIFMAILLVLSAIAAFFACKSNPYGYIYLIVYFVLNVFYSKWGKNIPIVDVAILSSGFLLRLMFGASIICVEVSGWLYLTVLAISFYLGLGKRRNELKLGKDTRDVLKYYSYEFLDKMMYMFMAIAVVFYSLWCVDAVTVARFSGRPVLFTVPIVILICMRYSMIVEGDSYGDPVDVVMKDKILIALCAIYAIIVALMLYVRWI